VRRSQGTTFDPIRRRDAMRWIKNYATSTSLPRTTTARSTNGFEAIGDRSVDGDDVAADAQRVTHEPSEPRGRRRPTMGNVPKASLSKNSKTP